MKIRVREYVCICVYVQYVMLTVGGSGEIKFRGGRIIFNNRTLFATAIVRTAASPVTHRRFQMSNKLNVFILCNIYVYTFFVSSKLFMYIGKCIIHVKVRV